MEAQMLQGDLLGRVLGSLWASLQLLSLKVISYCIYSNYYKCFSQHDQLLWEMKYYYTLAFLFVIVDLYADTDGILLQEV